MKWNFKFKKRTENNKPKKTKTREWLDAILFAVIVSTIFRGLLFSAYAIPSGSMENTLLTGDYLFVSKISYGPRMPFTPVQIPFLESTVTKNNIKTYWDGIELPYFRLPGISEIKKGDIVVFNKPEEADPVFNRPVDVRTNLIKRCLATSGDELSIINSRVYINGKSADFEKVQTSYLVSTDGTDINPQLIKDMHLTIMQQQDNNTYEMIIPTKYLSTIKSYPWVKNVIPVVQPTEVYDKSIFPHNEKFKWNADNFGPIIIPKKGWTVQLTDSTMMLYRRAIELYENNKVELKGPDIFINGKKADSYTFKMNYFWMMGDNRHNSIDSRFWGYVPEDHIVGKAMITWMSIDSTENLLNKVRWNRILKPIN
ncbi:signal peptidase I [Rubrolithibacter danxiaensis]|uniref:signal peptidase I n=1 Tax=Rubrolithibacter danxiaensis TaxID=3390805 RepID=UPI003BF8B436